MNQLKTYRDAQFCYETSEVPNILKWVTPNTRVLEFGPAYGYMTRYMREKLNCSVVAIELNPEMAKNLTPYTEKVIVADLDKDDWNLNLTGKFDYIIFADVLEHLRFPAETLSKATPFLKEGGCVLTSIPNINHAGIIMSLQAGEFNYSRFGLLDDTHVYFFTRKSIFSMMHKIGLSCLDERSYYNRPGETEFRKTYIQNPSALFSVLMKGDTSVYQFVNKWGKRNLADLEEIPNLKAFHLTPFSAIMVLIRDFNDYYEIKKGKRLHAPSWLHNFLTKKGLY